MTTTSLSFDIRTTIFPLEVYLQNLKSLRSLRNLSAFEVEGFEAFEIFGFSERYPKDYVSDVCEKQKRQKNVPKEYTLKCRQGNFLPCFSFRSCKISSNNYTVRFVSRIWQEINISHLITSNSRAWFLYIGEAGVFNYETLSL